MRGEWELAPSALRTLPKESNVAHQHELPMSVTPGSTSSLPIALFDSLSEPVLIFDAALQVVFANSAALSALPCRVGMNRSELGRVFDVPLIEWLVERTSPKSETAYPPPHPSSPFGARDPVLSSLSADRWALVLPIAERQAASRMPPQEEISTTAASAIYEVLWNTPFPVVLQDEHFRIVDCNLALAGLLGLPREGLLGKDLISFASSQQRPAIESERTTFIRSFAQTGVGQNPTLKPLVSVQNWLDGSKVVQVSTHFLRGSEKRRRLISLIQPTWAESQHSVESAGLRQSALLPSAPATPIKKVATVSGEAELSQWFDQTPQPMLLIDQAGKVLQSNSALRDLIGSDFMDMAEASRELRTQFNWGISRPTVPISPGGHWYTPEIILPGRGNDQVAVHARSLLLCHQTCSGEIRYLYILEPKIAQDRRDTQQFRSGTPFDFMGAGRALTASREAPVISLRPSPADLLPNIRPSSEEPIGSAEALTAALMLDSASAGLALIREFRITRCNQRFEQILGLQAGSTLGTDLRQLLSRRTGGLRSPELLDSALRANETFEDEFQIIGAEDTVNWYALTVHPQLILGVPHQSVVMTDITRLRFQQEELETLSHERANLTQMLLQQGDRNRAVLDSMLVGVVTVNAQGTITWLNRPARRMFSGDLRDFYGEPLSSVAPPEQIDHPFRHATDILKGMNDSETAQFEGHVQGRDGRRFWVVGNMVATHHLTGGRELTFILMDMDQRRMAEARVADARGLLNRIMSAAPMAITIHDAQTLAIEQINQIAASIIGIAPEEAVGCTPDQLFPPELAGQLRDDMRSALSAADQVTQREYIHDTPQGQRTRWDARFLPLAAPQGAPDQLLMVAADITAQREQLDVLIAQREMLIKEVQSRVRHNLQDVTTLLRQVGTRRPEIQAVLGEVVGQVQAIAQVYGLVSGPSGVLRVDAVVETVAQSVQRTFGQVFDLRFAPQTSGWVLPEGESIPFALIVNELLGNAIKHSDTDSPLSAHLSPLANGLRLEVVNEGHLPVNFRVEHRPTSVAGLGLVRALLPRRHASLSIEQNGTQVWAVIELHEPVIARSPISDTV